MKRAALHADMTGANLCFVDARSSSSGADGQSGDGSNSSGGHVAIVVLSVIFTVLLLGCLGEPTVSSLCTGVHKIMHHQFKDLGNQEIVSVWHMSTRAMPVLYWRVTLHCAHW
jgi:hypothetical protein